jgi:hypothetical protein
MPKAISLFFLGLLLACQPATNDEAIEQGVRTYLSAQGVTINYNISVEDVAGDYARARIVPADPNATDPAAVFLKRNEDGTWKGLIYGTAFVPEDYSSLGIPERLRLE